MDIRKFVLDYYKDATEDFYITRINNPVDTLTPHVHEYYQAFYVIGGTMLHHTASGVAELSAGDVFILPPNLPHHIEAEPGKVDFYALSFMPAFFRGIQESNRMVYDFLQYLTSAEPESIPLRLTLPNGDIRFAESLFKRILEEFSGDKTGKEAVVKSCVTVLLSLFARIYFEQRAETLRPGGNREAVLYCMEYIREHCTEQVTLPEIARRCAMSRSCFCKLFGDVAGVPFKQYLNDCRIARAAELLRAGEKVTAVSILCGYEDFSTFYRNFVRVMEISPAAYQKRHKEGK